MVRRMLGTTILHMFLIAFVFMTSAAGEGFELLGSIPSSNGLCYTTMAPQGNFIAMGDQRSPGVGIDIINVEDPGYMFEVGHVYTGHMTYQLAWSGNFIYSPASWDGLFIYDVNDFRNIVLAADTSFGEHLGVVAIRGEIAIVSGSNHLYSIDITNPYSPQVIWSSNALGCSYLVLGDSIAYAYRLYNDVILMDISDLERPEEISRFRPVDVNGLCPSSDERYLYLTGQRDGLIIYDISNPETPRFISQTPLPNDDWCSYVCVSEKYPRILFVSAYIDGLWAVDVSDPQNPIPLDNYRSSLCSGYVLSEYDVVFNTIADSMLALRFEMDPVSAFQDSGGGSTVERISLYRNYPNPFNTSTTISFSLAEPQNVRIAIYDLLCRQVDILGAEFVQRGQHQVVWDASGHSSGIYFYRIEAKEFTETRKMLLLR